jgi:hypothetical protein
MQTVQLQLMLLHSSGTLMWLQKKYGRVGSVTKIVLKPLFVVVANVITAVDDPVTYYAAGGSAPTVLSTID